MACTSIGEVNGSLRGFLPATRMFWAAIQLKRRKWDDPRRGAGVDLEKRQDNLRKRASIISHKARNQSKELFFTSSNAGFFRFLLV